jgi:hypothetical protein
MRSFLLGALIGAYGSLLLRHRQLKNQPDPLDELTKEELYRRAQAANIAGRSEMTKEELIAALRKLS